MKKVFLLIILLLIIGCTSSGSLNYGLGENNPFTFKTEESSVKTALIILPPQDFRDDEFFVLKGILNNAGISVLAVTNGVSQAKDISGNLIKANLDLSQVDLNKVDAIIFVSDFGAKSYFEDKKILEFVKKANDQDKIIAAIGTSPSILANAGILNGKKATSAGSEQNNLLQKKVKYILQPITTEGNIITCQGIQYLQLFGKEITFLLNH